MHTQNRGTIELNICCIAVGRQEHAPCDLLTPAPIPPRPPLLACLQRHAPGPGRGPVPGPAHAHHRRKQLHWAARGGVAGDRHLPAGGRAALERAASCIAPALRLGARCLPFAFHHQPLASRVVSTLCCLSPQEPIFTFTSVYMNLFDASNNSLSGQVPPFFGTNGDGVIVILEGNPDLVLRWGGSSGLYLDDSGKVWACLG